MDIEPLETRIAPASIAITYTDLDGDLVKITAKAPGAAVPPLDANDLFFTDGNPDGQLAILLLADPLFAGANITFAVTKKPGGDGLAHAGAISAGGVDLGAITIKGDLGQIDAGDGDPATAALKSLSVRSMGRFGLATQGGIGNLESDIHGALGSLTVAGDITEARINVFGGANATIGPVTVGGSVIGGAGANGGEIFSSGGMGVVKIGGDLIGGDGTSSGRIVSVGAIVSLSIGGSVLGSTGNGSGRIGSDGDIGAVKIARDVIGGDGTGSGRLFTAAKLTSATVGGSVRGGDGANSGDISSLGDLGAVKIGRDLIGGDGVESGRVFANTTLTSVSIGGAVVGGSMDRTGEIFANFAMGPVKIGRDLIGGSGSNSARISASGMTSLAIGGSVVGGAGASSAEISSSADMGAVKIAGDLIGGSAPSSGRISVTGGGNVASLSIGGSLLGGSANNTGEILVSSGNLGPLKIGRDVIGGSITAAESLDESGFIRAGRIASVFIGGSMIAGADDSSGALTRNASIRANHDIGAITIKGSLVGRASTDGDPGDGAFTPVVITARGPQGLPAAATSEIAIKSLGIGGRVELAKVLAGFDAFSTDTAGSNNNASIGAVSVGGDWIASSLAAGVQDTGGNGFGNGDDTLIAAPPADALIAKIASIAIKGIVTGSAAGGDHFGFTAQQIGSFKSLGFTAPLTAGPDTVPLSLSTGDVTLREV